MKKIIAILLLLSMLLGILVSCTDEQSQNKGTQESESQEDVISDGLPEVDMNGFDFKIKTHNPSDFGWAEISISPNPDDSMGNVIYQEMFERNSYVEQRFNCFITVDSENALNTNTIQNMVLGNDPNSAHILMYYDKEIMNSASFFRDWNDCPYINMDSEYWNPGISGLYNINDYQYAVSGSFSLGMISRTGVMIFNKDMYEKYIDPDVSTMYKYVDNNEWTLEKLYEIAAGAVVENGDDVWDEKDQYGISQSKKDFYTNLMVGCGIRFVDKNDKGKLALVANQSGTIDKLEKILTLNQGNDIYYDTSNDINRAGKNHFIEKRTLFFVPTLYDIPTIRASMEEEFGILPMPKYNTEQKQFYASCFGGDMACILKTVTDEELENIGILMEALAFNSHENLIPLYKDELIRTRYASDPDSRRMLDIIFASTTTDFGINALEQIVTYDLINKVYKPEENTISSTLLSISVNVNLKIDTLMKGIK